MPQIAWPSESSSTWCWMRDSCPVKDGSAPGSQNDVLWQSENSRFGIVRKVVVSDPYAAQFDDLNGDYREVCLTVFRRRRSSWTLLSYMDDAGYPAVGEEPVRGWSDGYTWAAGRNVPGARIRVLLRNKPYTVEADADGWRLFVRRSRPPKNAIRSPESFLTFTTC